MSFRDELGQWDPSAQRPEVWSLYNGRVGRGEHVRVFPLSNWTELDIWRYIAAEELELPSIYFAHERSVIARDGMLLADHPFVPKRPGEVPMQKMVRFRTLGCYPLTGAVESTADTLPAVIQEMLLARTSERQGRMIDHDASASMEKKKQEGYF